LRALRTDADPLGGVVWTLRPQGEETVIALVIGAEVQVFGVAE